MTSSTTTPGITADTDEMMRLEGADLEVTWAREDQKRARRRLIDASAQFGAAARAAREYNRLSLRDVARLIGCSHVHLGEIERGDAIPSARLRIRIIRALRGEP